MLIKEKYQKYIGFKTSMILGTFILTLFLGYCFTTTGIKNIPFLQTFTAIQCFFAGTLDADSEASVNKIILFLRLPRILLALLAGIGLSASGAIMQSITRNNLVSPFTLGISSSAAFGASVCIVFGNNLFFQSDIGIISCAFISSCICGMIVYGIAGRTGSKPTSIVLIGIALNYLFSAMTAIIEFFAKEHRLAAVVQWTFGSFNRANWSCICLCTIMIIISGVVFLYYCLPLSAMANNDDETVKSLGINPKTVRTVTGLFAVLTTATIISFTGVIGFVGLIAPHIARFIVGGEHQFHLIFSSIVGALLLLLSDTVGKFILYPVNIPVGIIVSFLGVPLFIHLILQRKSAS